MSDYITDDQGRTWMRVNSTRGTYYAPTFQSDFETPPAPVVMYTAPYQPTYVENVFSTFFFLMHVFAVVVVFWPMTTFMAYGISAGYDESGDDVVFTHPGRAKAVALLVTLLWGTHLYRYIRKALR